AGAGRGPADRRALRVGGAGGARPRAGLGEVAHARRGAALDRARLERVGRAAVRAAVAALREVAVAGGGTADRGALRIGGAGGARPRAGLGEITDARRGPAFDCARLEDIGGAIVGAAIAALRYVAWAPCWAADRRDLRVGGAGYAGTRAVLCEIADPGCRTALHRCRLEGIGRA